ncbi:aminotransferase class IV [Deinococcus aquiradiocola]|uniref:Aminotransferase class IV n=1 Tax=Deinococcus aquiradiocola TaxID=393059 RepID=A0A917UP11_9DEIO|nr:aminotransferase class IV [Deinococcus aquiradiocola]GGJ71490.1 hypothetical protein GCM10008939_14840 [Deinococcus aquiradiocola]
MPSLPAEFGSAWLHGLSAFSTVRTRAGAPLLLDAHLDRLAGTCALLGLPAPDPQVPALDTALPWGLLRLTVTPDGTYHSHRPLPAQSVPQTGAAVWWGDAQVHPLLGLHKTGNYVPYLLAARDAAGRGALEGLLSDAAGCAVDGSRSGLLLRSGREFLVPDGGLPSVTRAAWLAELGVQARPVPVTPGVLRGADRVWLCGAGLGVVPVGQVSASGWTRAFTAQWPVTRHPALVPPA